jgi:hypothetical protein
VDNNHDLEITEEEQLIDKNESGVVEAENKEDRNNQAGADIEHQEQEIEHQEADEQMNNNENELIDAEPYDLRPNRIRDFSYRFAFLSVREGLQKFGELGRIAIVEELQLFLDEQVFIFMDSLTDEQKQKALRIHCFLTEKRDGRIKARAVADGRSQKRYLEEETYSPTVRLESIMLCSLIDALEQRYVATIDIKGAFLKAKVPGDLELIVKMDGELAETFVDLNPDFKLEEYGVLYLRCDKALYGHIEAVRLFYMMNWTIPW